jgi:RNA polymerase sigma factor (sigma-70 family)
MMTDNMALLQEYARTGSEAAFAELVRRHVSLVYSVACHDLRDTHLAEDATQAVFIILARKAASLGPNTVLPGWLCRTVHNVSANALKTQRRRALREQEAAMEMHTQQGPPEDAWNKLAPWLGTGLQQLKEQDQDALVLRYFENRSLSEVGQAMGISEMAAGKRVNRALEKLRKFFLRRGVTLSAAALGSLLAANAVQASPASLAATATAAAMAPAAGASTASSTLAKSTLGQLKWLRWRLPLGIGTALVVATATLVVVRQNRPTPAPAPPPPPAPQTVVLEDNNPPPVREPLRLSSLMTLDTPVGAVLVQPDGRTIVGSTVGGFFVDEQSGAIGYYNRGAMRFETNGALDRTFLCSIDRSGYSSAMMAHLSQQQDGRVFVTGLFNTVGDKTRLGQAMLLPDGSPDPAYEPWRDSTNVPGLHHTYLPGGTLLGTTFPDGSTAIMSPSIEGPRQPYPWTAYHLDSTGRLMPPAPETLSGGEFSRPSGLVMTLGPVGFWARKPIDWSRTMTAARRPPFNPTGPPSDAPAHGPVSDLPFERFTEPPSAVDAAVVLHGLFEEVPLELCRYAVRLPDGGVILAIRDEVVNGSLKAHGRFMRFDKYWQPDFSFTNTYEANLHSEFCIKRQPDGKLLVGGIVGSMNDLPFPGLVRLNEDGSLDQTFRCETANSVEGRVMDIALQPDGKIVIVGFFQTVNGTFCPRIARLHPDGSLDQTFRPPFLSMQEFQRKRFLLRVLPAAVASSGPTNPSPGANSAAATPPETVVMTSIALEASAAAIRITGRPNQAYVLQASETLSPNDWTNLSTNRTSSSGSALFRDPDAKRFSMRCYRIALP